MEIPSFRSERVSLVVVSIFSLGLGHLCVKAMYLRSFWCNPWVLVSRKGSREPSDGPTSITRVGNLAIEDVEFRQLSCLAIHSEIHSFICLKIVCEAGSRSRGTHGITISNVSRRGEEEYRGQPSSSDPHP